MTTPANATEFFVRAGGSDSADGLTPVTAFATIGHAADALRNAGDRITVGPGTYVEGNIAPAHNGIPGRPVEFVADASGADTGDPPGPVLITPPATQTTGFLLLGRHHVIIDGFTILGAVDAGIQIRSSADGTMNSANVTVRNAAVRQCVKRGIDVTADGDIAIDNNETSDNGGAGISIAGAGAAGAVPVISNNRVLRNGSHGIFILGAHGGVVQNNVSVSNGGTGVTVRQAGGVLLANNLVYVNAADGVAVGTGDLPSPDAVIVNNTVYDNGGWGLVIGTNVGASANGVVLNNIFELNRNGGIAVAGSSTCGYVAGFNITVGAYGPDTPVNAYDIRTAPAFVRPAGVDNILGGDGYADDDFRLRQLRGGQASDSAGVNVGSAAIAALGLTGTTASNDLPDVGIVDIGYHYGASADQSIAAPLPYMPLFVRASGNDSNNGLDPRQALASIQQGARKARAGATLVVGPGRYAEGDIHPEQNAGRTALFADSKGIRTGDVPGVVLVDATGKDTGFVLLRSCNAAVDGFYVTGAGAAGIQVRTGSEGARIRNNVVFSNARRGIEILGADNGEVRNNLVYANGSGGVRISTSSNSAAVDNTSYGNADVGILVGGDPQDEAAPNSSVVRNIVAHNGKGIKVTTNSLAGYVTGYNVAPDGFAADTPRADSDFIVDPLLVNPAGRDAVLGGTGFLDDDFHLQQSGSTMSAAVDIDFSALNVLADGSTRLDELPDVGLLDAGYHASFVPRPPVPRRVRKVVFVRAGGSDGNDGTSPSKAFASVGMALRAVSHDGLVILGPGSYSERGLTLGRADGAGGMLVVVGDAGGALTGDAAGQVSVDAGGGAGPVIMGSTVLDGLALTGARASGLRILRTAQEVTVRNTTVCGNRGGGVVITADGVAATNNLIQGNGGAGISLRLARAQHTTQLFNNTVAGNTGQGIVIHEMAAAASHAMLYNNIVSGNRGRGMSARVVRRALPGSGRNLNTDGYGPRTPPGAGDLSADPQFVGGTPLPAIGCLPAATFRLAPDSAAIDAGVATAIEIGLGSRSATAAAAPDSGATDLGFHDRISE